MAITWGWEGWAEAGEGKGGINGDGRRQLGLVNRLCSTELYTWNLRNFINQCHPNKSNKIFLKRKKPGSPGPGLFYHNLIGKEYEVAFRCLERGHVGCSAVPTTHWPCSWDKWSSAAWVHSSVPHRVLVRIQRVHLCLRFLLQIRIWLPNIHCINILICIYKLLRYARYPALYWNYYNE